MNRKRRRICFVTGTRAEFGLMRSTLEAIHAHPDLALRLVVTGMHLHARHGKSIDAIRDEGWKIDAVVPWKYSGDDPKRLARQTGLAMAGLAGAIDGSDVVLVVGDRVEAFAAAAAGHVGRKIVAHVHGGDRAVGQIDDSLRHAITKLSHIHFAATADSAQRLAKLGEDRFRIHCVGSPGVDGIRTEAKGPAEISRLFPNLRRRRFALIVLHPAADDGRDEEHNAEMLLSAVKAAGIEQTVVIYPNNDPGSGNIIRCWQRRRGEITYLLKDAPRPVFLGLLRDAAVLVGNSSSGIIEAASLGTRVVDIGPRQHGRLRSENVTNVPYRQSLVRTEIKRIWNNGSAMRFTGRNVYGSGQAGRRIARLLATLALDDRRLRQKLIVY